MKGSYLSLITAMERPAALNLQDFFWRRSASVVDTILEKEKGPYRQLATGLFHLISTLFQVKSIAPT
jgi:hypothetical protein